MTLSCLVPRFSHFGISLVERHYEGTLMGFFKTSFGYSFGERIFTNASTVRKMPLLAAM